MCDCIATILPKCMKSKGSNVDDIDVEWRQHDVQRKTEIQLYEKLHILIGGE